MAAKYDVQVQSLEACAADFVSVEMSRPKEFTFTAGQWMVLSLPAGGGDSLSETFTISSAPSDPYLQITTRVSRSAFKQRLLSLRQGDRVSISGPGGRLVLPPEAGRIAFLVGGVGITPVRSMLREACASGFHFDDALVFFGNRDDSCVPFGSELEAMATCGVRTVLCYESPPVGWDGESGLITASMVRRYLPSGDDDRPFVVAGPPMMVEAMVSVLDELGVPPERRLVERFGAKSGTGAA